MPHNTISSLQTSLDMCFNVSSSISSISKLDISNYTIWAIYMKTTFGVHNPDQIIDGSKMVPTDVKEALEFA
jgi:hypothetical protein